ncbi:MAG: hypothetical protein ACREGF_02565, partial [Candidatus Saccharimonadales bacterium]
MPSRNVLKIDTAETYYHVYARGASRQAIFLDNDDYAVLLNLYKRYLSKKVSKDNRGLNYNNFYDEIEL